MTITLVLMAALMALFVGWLVSRSISVTPWVAEPGPMRTKPATSMTSPKVGLLVFLAVVMSLFALFISAYHMRMHMGDWRPLPEPGILFVNTGFLLLASVALEWAARCASYGDSRGLMRGLAAGGAGAIVFIAGQLAGLATTDRLRIFSDGESRQRVLLRAHRAARVALARRAGRMGPTAPESVARKCVQRCG